MRLFVNYTLVYLAIMLGYYLSWRTWQPNLNGHWHIVDEELSNGRNSTDYISTLDFVDHNTFILDPFTYDGPPMAGKINRLSRKGQLFYDSFSMEFTYHFATLDLIVIELKGPKKKLVLRGKACRYKCLHKKLHPSQ